MSGQAHASGAVETVGLMSPGDMGHAIGATLRHGGLRVVTCLEGRSARTRALAAEAGLEDAGSDEALVREADVLLSVLVPSEALGLAERLAKAIRATGATRTAGTDLVYADLNAVAPQTARRIGEVVTAAGARFVDGGIIGGPPKSGGSSPRIYLSGADAVRLATLGEHGLDVRLMGGEIGQASGLKMCYAALTKGLTALGTELLTAAHALREELQASQPVVLRQLERGVPGMPPKAYRWVGEMEEIAATFGALGLTPRMLEGAAELYRFVEQTSLGQETPEERTHGTTLDEVVAILAGALPRVE
ncbi:MAG: 3-hydroxyisobutyrate dehydrogenase and related beta-hydroxyacid dehydrogenases [uncultured Chloroflexi bacterium]|uniref:3-hydroxyisobutyrate dehydrogenase and related beta-hydroxyacid dehydrogenases n=1 Tax=uncultured Chloroflexota bacterium TaxID=166587 RepID=A0A6J4K702_9CHLR|nr:MAG: 3-hydroxyisobutyrate dehydrogenase and related beta-hydroxyacid dehydrogenases [uncultured Chloroflexota bacterium]